MVYKEALKRISNIKDFFYLSEINRLQLSMYVMITLL